jgi:hypothetical protein
METQRQFPPEVISDSSGNAMRVISGKLLYAEGFAVKAAQCVRAELLSLGTMTWLPLIPTSLSRLLDGTRAQ